jgi:hypothetical protein
MGKFYNERGYRLQYSGKEDNCRQLMSPSPFFSMTRSRPFMRMNSFDPSRNVTVLIVFFQLYIIWQEFQIVAGVGRTTATSDNSGISIDEHLEATMSEIDQELDSNASNGFHV